MSALCTFAEEHPRIIFSVYNVVRCQCLHPSRSLTFPLIAVRPAKLQETANWILEVALSRLACVVIPLHGLFNISKCKRSLEITKWEDQKRNESELNRRHRHDDTDPGGCFFTATEKSRSARWGELMRSRVTGRARRSGRRLLKQERTGKQVGDTEEKFY